MDQVPEMGLLDPLYSEVAEVSGITFRIMVHYLKKFTAKGGGVSVLHFPNIHG